MKYKDSDIVGWPRSWAGDADDVAYGEKVLPYMKEFIAGLKQKNLTIATVNSYIDDLWALGGKVVEALHDDEKNKAAEPVHVMYALIDAEGGPLLDAEQEQASFDRTCKKFYRFLKDRYKL